MQDGSVSPVASEENTVKIRFYESRFYRFTRFYGFFAADQNSLYTLTEIRFYGFIPFYRFFGADQAHS